ncbi:hypothetical protein KGA66_01965 [Actinocrinis puniceicyclus]|uniref:Uncharacterized protein n=1 Tax=Actinocrinis puniceicyclus TaxID=977794 RepID=A0A8J7WKI1_9ACTN|nr:hypothetical protein [Actinocrinis puniceicyclus]MBS2961797.1 hypothetical protein [Actinocrinis puniceicyclus]
MMEVENQTETGFQAAEATADTGTPPFTGAAPRSVARGRALIAAGAVLSIAVGAAAGTVVVRQREDSNKRAIAAAQAAAAARPAPLTGGVRSDGSHYGSLFAYLLPLPDGYTPGPYDADYGDNGYVPAAQITSQLEDLLSGIPKSDLSNAKGALANTHLKGVAVRTMESSASTADLVVSIELLQFDVKDAKNAATSFTSLVSDLNVFRTGPTVPGYAQAKCVLPPGLGSDKLDEMLCVASSGDVEIMVDAQGSAPLDQNKVATLVARQLDQLKTAQSIDE